MQAPPRVPFPPAVLEGLIQHVQPGWITFQQDGQVLHLSELASALLHLAPAEGPQFIQALCQQCHNLNGDFIDGVLREKRGAVEWVQGVQVHYFALQDEKAAGAIVLFPRPADGVSQAPWTGSMDALFEISPDCLKYLDAQGHLLRMNENGRRLMQVHDFDVLKNQLWETLWPEESRPALRQAVQEARMGKVGRFQGWCPTAQQVWRCWDVVVMPVIEGQHLTGLVASSRDITDQAVVEQSKQEVLQKQERFLSDAAHEIKTPLAAMQGNLDMLFRYADIPEGEKQEILRDIHGSVTRLSRLVSDMLLLARGTAGIRRDMEMQLHEVALSAWREAQLLSSRHHFELKTIQPVELYGDPDRIKQLLLILLENAVKYTPPGGEVSLAVEQVGNHVHLQVQDTGVGIPAEHQHRIFERFYRVHARTEHQPGGSGLGLSIAQWIVEGHGGRIHLRSTEGQGATFEVVLPIDDEVNP